MFCNTLTIDLLALLFLLQTIPAFAQETQTKVSLSDKIGEEIDTVERNKYRLFPDIKGFENGRFIQKGEKYRLVYSVKDITGLKQKSVPISQNAFELTQLHVRLTETYENLKRPENISSENEAEIIYRLAVKYASQTRYDVASRLFEDLVKEYPETAAAQRTDKMSFEIQRLAVDRKALFYKGSLLDHSGRTELLIFSGYYGLWLGIATPIVFETESAQVYAAGLILGGPLALVTTLKATHDANMSRARATMLILGGHWGTWQGLGWAGVAELDGSQVVGYGELAGLLSIGAASYITGKYDFSEGHAALTSTGLEWGAWLGLVFAMLANHEEKDILRDMLIGSDLCILASGLTTQNVQMSKNRVRLINLAGVLGAMLGFGIDLFAEVDDGSAVFAIAGLGSLAGAYAGFQWTRNYDEGKEFTLYEPKKLLTSHQNSNKMEIFPRFTLKQHPALKTKFIPSFGINIQF